jgi:predicted lipoprotein
VTRARSHPAFRSLGVLALALGALAIVRPWTVRPLKPAAVAFDPTKYAEEAWPRLVAEASRSAVDVSSVSPPASSAGTPGRTSIFVKAAGTLLAVDRRSRVGLLRLGVAGRAGREVTVQIGPVVRGTALRDAAGFIRFNDFANQFDHAAVSNALHERVLREVVGRIDLDGLAGRSIDVVGATTIYAGMAADAPLDIVPVRLSVPGGAQ